MNKFLRTVLLGLVVWGIPFIASIFLWNTKTNAPAVDLAWFYAAMSVTGAVGFILAAKYQFKNVKDPVKEGWTAGAIWYVELVLLDFLVLVGLFGMSLTSYWHLLLSYLTPALLSVSWGYLKK